MLVTRNEIAEMSGISRSKLNNIIAAGKTEHPDPIRIVSKKYFYDRKQVMEWLEKYDLKKIKVGAPPPTYKWRIIDRSYEISHFNKQVMSFLARKTAMPIKPKKEPNTVIRQTITLEEFNFKEVPCKSLDFMYRDSDHSRLAMPELQY